MAISPLARLATVDVKGGLWGADLLAALAEDRASLPKNTVTAESYGLPARASTEQAARAAWTTLTAAWDEFSEHHTKRIGVFETPQYGDDSFTWDTWTRHLLTQLGFDPTPTTVRGLPVDNADPDDPTDRYPITHTHHDQIAIHALAAGVPLDSRTAGVTGASRRSPHSLVQDYLNRTSRHLWALLTNGLTLRLLRDNAALSRQAYIEFDLAAIFEEGAYADFALLWHACHTTRFTHPDDQGPAGCIAETWQDHATSTGVAALEDLRDGVEAAIAEMGQGLIEHRDNEPLRDALADPTDPFDAAAFYRELLYIAYRHVFWFALDDRDLLHPSDADRHKVTTYRDHYASTILRHKARAHLGGHHPDGWQHFHTVAGWFAIPDGCPDLAIPGLLGALWDPASTPHVNGTSLTNRRYYEAVRRLGYVQRDGVPHRINYDNMISEELGAVYESLLEIRSVADPVERTFTPDRTAGSDRKKTGSYYTPTPLIKILLDEALDPVLDDRIKQAIHDLPAGGTPDQHQQAQEQAILGTTICDPAMGSAHFLTAAGMRVAKRLAAVRTGEIEPGPGPVHQAFRDVASHCLYGVDVNPMAVELAKVAIWLECHVPGQPLTFLDHHLRHGNALLGVGLDPDLIAWDSDASRAADQGGVPDAAFKPLAGDDKAHARALRDTNKKRRSTSRAMRLGGPTPHTDDLTQLATDAAALTGQDDDTPEALAAKQRAHTTLQQDPELVRQRLRADAWTTCWTMTKTQAATEQILGENSLGQLPWDVYYDTFVDDPVDLDSPGSRAVAEEAQRLAFFHWYLEFPDIAADGGFSLMLGNPPWERVKLAEKEWFAAAGYDDIAGAKNAAARKNLIAGLADSDDPIDRQTADAWEQDSRDAQAISELARSSGRYPLGGVGDVNTYALFADHFTHSVAPTGRVGIIVPTGLITDYTYRDFFATLVDQRRLAAAYDFENKGKRFFPEVHASFRFVTLIATAPDQAPEARFAFMIHDTAELDHGDRSYTLTPEQIISLNPVTKLAPSMLTAMDVELALRASQRLGSLRENWPWETRAGIVLASVDGTDVIAEERQAFRSLGGYAGLFEAKAAHHYDLRRTTYSDGESYAPLESQLASPDWLPTMRNSVSDHAVARKLTEISHGSTMVGWRDIARDTDVRTLIPVVLPVAGVDNTFNLAFPEHGDPAVVMLVGMMSTFPADWALRQRAAGTHVKPHMVESLPLPGPADMDRSSPWQRDVPLGAWIASRAAALSAATTLMAERLGYEAHVEATPAARETWRVELDAAMFILYGYSRDEVEYVMDTFPIVAHKDRQAEGLVANDPNWRTKRLILEKYDELGRHSREGTVYTSPDPPPPLPKSLQIDATVGSGTTS